MPKQTNAGEAPSAHTATTFMLNAVREMRVSGRRQMAAEAEALMAKWVMLTQRFEATDKKES